jgi:hypothetical protein
VILWGVLLIGTVVLFWFAYQAINRYWKRYYYPKATHLVMITQNNQHQVEWMIRSYYYAHHFNGRSGRITCLDIGSTDDTLPILRKLKSKYEQLQIISLRNLGPADSQEEAITYWLKKQQSHDEKVIVLDLREAAKEESKNSA